MKSVGQVTALVADYGTFCSLSEKLAETMERVYYFTPYQTEYQNIRNSIKGTGLKNVTRLDEFLDPKILKTIDLFVFPDIGFGDLQRYLRSIGKAVWGHFGASDLELQRDLFLEVLKEVGLPTIHSETIIGLTALSKYLKEHDDKWIKVNRYRANLETFHHHKYGGSTERMLNSLAVIFGGCKEDIIFVVQDEIESEREIGYDGRCIDGQFPSHSFQGYEKKNELYLGSLLAYDDLPEELRIVNEAFAPVLAGYGYRDWWATEVRVKDDIPYFIDPTPRMAGQTMEHQLETVKNFAEIIWYGANGIMIEDDVNWNFAAEATLHYDLKSKDPAIHEEWKSLDLPPEVFPWIKLYHYCRTEDGIYHFVGEGTDEIGVMIGVGDDTQEAIDHLKGNLELIKDLPVSANTAGFADLLEAIKEAERAGSKFGGEIPLPETIFRQNGSL